ncbi:MAG TPA: hypothetical protein ACFE0H_06325 [Elainellaceae cyanobacterium]
MMAREMVRQELNQQLSPLIEAEIQHVVRSLQVERVIGATVVDYYVVSTSEEKPTVCPTDHSVEHCIHFLENLSVCLDQ